MRMDIKTVNGKNYLQIFDNRGYIHHIGPANLLNFAVCQRVLGLDDAFRLTEERLERLESYFASKGYPRWQHYEWGPAKNMASEVEIHYSDAWSGHTARTNSCGDASDITKKENEYTERIKIFEILEELKREEAQKEKIKYSEEDLRRKVQLSYRHASPEQKALWKKELERRIELEDKRIEQMIQERFEARRRAKWTPPIIRKPFKPFNFRPIFGQNGRMQTLDAASCNKRR